MILLSNIHLCFSEGSLATRAHKAVFIIRKLKLISDYRKNVQVIDLSLKCLKHSIEQYFLPLWGCSNLLLNMVFNMLINYISRMSHFLYIAHSLQDCISKRAAFAFLTFQSKRKKSVLFSKQKISFLACHHDHFPYSWQLLLLDSLGIVILRHHFT